MDADFVILKKKAELPPQGGISQIVKRAKIIRAIVNGDLLDYLTQSPTIFKLCKTCIGDTCSELAEAANWETKKYKAYKDYLYSGRKIDPDLILDIETSARESKENYTKYKELYNRLVNNSVKLLTKDCIICRRTKPHYTDSFFA